MLFVFVYLFVLVPSQLIFYADINALFAGSLKLKIFLLREIVHAISGAERKWLTAILLYKRIGCNLKVMRRSACHTQHTVSVEASFLFHHCHCINHLFMCLT